MNQEYLTSLPRGALWNIAIKMNEEELANLCKTNTKLKERICGSNGFWLFKIEREFGDISIPRDLQDKFRNNAKGMYDNLVLIDQLKDQPKNVLWSISNHLSIDEILTLCKINPKLNLKLCGNTGFWLNRIITEFRGVQISEELKTRCSNNYKCIYMVLAGN